MQLTKLKRQRATDEVYDALRQGILGSLFEPGQRLQVDEIADKLGVSLTPVRHAIQQLAAEGLIEIRPRSGTFVASLSPRDVEETFEIRCALECLAVEKAIANMTPELLRRLRELLASMAKPVTSEGAQKRHERDNFEFHRLLIEASGNRRLQETYEGLQAHLQIIRIHDVERTWGSRLGQEQGEHEAIVDAIAAADVAAAVEALRRHIYRAKDSLKARVDGAAHA